MDTKTLKMYCVWTLSAIAVVPLLVFNGFIFPFVTTKALLFFFFIDIAGILFLYLLLKDSELRIKYTKTILLFGMLLMLMMLSTIFSSNPYISFFSTLERMEGLFFWLHLGFLLFLFTNLFDKDDWYRFIKLFFFVSVPISFFGLSQYGGGLPLPENELRVSAIFGNPIFLSLYTIFSIALGLLLVKKHQGVFQKLVAIVVLFHILVLFMTGTRGALIAFVASLIASFVFAAVTSHEKKTKLVLIGAVVFVVATSVLLIATKNTAFVEGNTILKRFSGVSLEEVKTQPRYFIWDAAIQGVKEKPILGSGFEEFHSVYDRHLDLEYFGQDAITSHEHWVNRAHNMYLDIAVSHGLPAVLIFVLLLGSLAFMLLRAREVTHYEKTILLGLVVGYAAHSFFNFNSVTGLVLLVILLGVVSAFAEQRRELHVSKTIRNSVIFLMIALLIVSTLIVANRGVFAYGIRAQSDMSSLNEFSDGLFIDRRYALLEYPILVMDVDVEEITGTEANELVDMLNTNIDELVSPTAKELFFHGRALKHLRAYAEAERVLETALTLAPQKILVLHELGEVRRLDGDYEGSLEYYRRAYELEGEYRNSILEYAAALIFTNDVGAADEILVGEFGTTLIVYEPLLDSYMDAGLRDRVRETLRDALDRRPNDERFRELDEKYF